jgi:hypothetical protein
MIGTTGSGKTTLLRQLIPRRRFVVIFGVKGRDESMDKFIRSGYTRIERWDQNMLGDRLVLWPRIRGAAHTELQGEIFRDAIDGIFRQGGWCCVFDEVSYLSDTLRMERSLKFLLQQGRSSGVSVVGMTQRPAFIPLAFYDQATHLFVWRDNDHVNAERIGKLAGLANKQVQREVHELRRREVLYLNKDTGERARTIVEL